MALGDPKLDKYSKKLAWVMRKILKADPIGKIDTSKARPIGRQHLTTIPIGIKKDGKLPTGVEAI